MTRRPILALLLAFATSAAAQSPNQTQRLPGHIPAWASAAHDAGPVPAARELSHLVLTLQRPAARAVSFQQLLADQQDPTSAAYHHWLTPQQIGATYGPDPADIAALTSWLTAQGLRVETVSPTGLSITFSGPAQSVARSFSTELHLFTLPDATTRYAPTTEPSLPAALAPHIATITGLAEETVTPQHTMQQGPISLLGRTAPRSLATPNYTLSNNVHWLSPNDFATIYDLNPVYSSGINGAGTRVAVIGGSNVAATDITQYESLAALPRVLPNYIVVPGQSDPGQTQTSAQVEATLDVDRVIGTAPGAAVDLVTVASLADTNVLAALNYILTSTTDTVVNMSFGSCEQNTSAGATRVQSFDTVFQQAAAQGVTVVVSSGDAGAAECDTHGTTAPATQSLAANFLCASSHVTCVGGTEFIDTASPSTYWSTGNSTGRASALSYIPEGAWNEPGSSFIVAATGGGASFNIPKPAYQTGTGVPADGQRDSPDLSFSASGHNAYFVCLTYAGADCVSLIQGVGGTSASAPSFAGIVALANQTLGASQGSINPLLYRLAASPANNVFHDATIATSGVSGCTAATPSFCNNSTPGQGSLSGGQAGYLLTTGYDQATGLGSLDVANFLLAASGGVLTNLSASANPVTTSQTVSFTATLKYSYPGPTGNVQFVIDGVNAGSPIGLLFGVATLPAATYAAGAHTVVAIYSGDANYPGNRSAPLTLQVTGTTTPSTTLAITPAIIALTSSATATVSIPGTPAATGTVTLLRSGTPYLSQSLSGGAANFTLPGNNFGAGAYVFSASYSGDANYKNASSNPVYLTVASIVLQPSAPPTVSSGTSTGSNIAVISNYFTGTVAMSCALTTTSFPTYPATCSITSPPAFTSGGSAVVALTINSTTPHSRPGTGAAAALTLAALALVLFRRRALPVLAMLLLCALTTLTGCGSGKSSSTPTGPLGSSAATYNVTITAVGTGNVTITTTAATAVTIQ